MDPLSALTSLRGAKGLNTKLFQNEMLRQPCPDMSPVTVFGTFLGFPSKQMAKPGQHGLQEGAEPFSRKLLQSVRACVFFLVYSGFSPASSLAKALSRGLSDVKGTVVEGCDS